MHRLDFFLVCLIVFSAVCCGRTSLDTVVDGGRSPHSVGGAAEDGGGSAAKGTISLGGAETSGGGPAAGGTTSLGGAVTSGGSLVAGGAGATGGSSSTSDGSVSTDLDTCASDADCITSCIWTTAPKNSGQCTGYYCCGETWMSTKRCEANQAAWTAYCPDQAPQPLICPCVTQCSSGAASESFACVAGRCTVVCEALAIQRLEIPQFEWERRLKRA
jgi:hypothetical protein